MVRNDRSGKWAEQTGKADFADSCITITDERKESMLFSSANYHGGIVMAVMKTRGGTAAAQEDTSFLGSIAASFEKTFIREDRWKLFTDGLLTTLLITVLSILCGTVLGFLVFMLCRNGNVIANAITR
jgi:polar amino acid transport system substrate-binding protein